METKSGSWCCELLQQACALGWTYKGHSLISHLVGGRAHFIPFVENLLVLLDVLKLEWTTKPFNVVCFMLGIHISCVKRTLNEAVDIFFSFCDVCIILDKAFYKYRLEYLYARVFLFSALKISRRGA
jgi:hypothetical protein